MVQKSDAPVDAESIYKTLKLDKQAQQSAMEARQHAREEERKEREELHDRQAAQYELDRQANQRRAEEEHEKHS